MKSSYLRAAVALACALGLSACGGSSGDLLLGGYAYNVTKEGLVLQNNGASDLAVPASGAFYFKELIGVDAQYNVTVKSIPPNTEECKVTNGSGRSAFNVNSVIVTCTLKTHALHGTVVGLAADSTGLVVVNGADRVAVEPDADPSDGVPFDMAKVGEDSPYGISILTQPAHRVCTVANGTGKMGTADVTGVQITCVDSGA